MPTPSSRGPKHSQRCASCCKNLGLSLIEWLNDADQNSIDTLCDALGCTDDIDTIKIDGASETLVISGDGSDEFPYHFEVFADTDSDNAVEQGPNGGVFVHNAKLEVDGNGELVFTDNTGDSYNVGVNVGDYLQAVETKDNNAIHLIGDGRSGTELEAQAQISADSGNALYVKPDGLYAPAAGGGGGVQLSSDPDQDITMEPDGIKVSRLETALFPPFGTFTDSDSGSILVGSTSYGLATFNIPSGLSVGFRLDLVGEIAIDNMPSGEFLRSQGGKDEVAKNGGATLVKIDSTTWWLAGDLV